MCACACACVCSHVTGLESFYPHCPHESNLQLFSGSAVYYWIAIFLFSSLMLKTGAEILVHFNHLNPALGKLLIRHIRNRRDTSHESRPLNKGNKIKTSHFRANCQFFFIIYSKGGGGVEFNRRWFFPAPPLPLGTDSPQQYCVYWSRRTKAFFIKPTALCFVCLCYVRGWPARRPTIHACQKRMFIFSFGKAY